MFALFFLRRIVTVTLCAGSFWAGMKADGLWHSTAVPTGTAAVSCAPANGN